ncbi:MAG: DUF4440 domain-containing protein [Flavobacterium sp.]
MKKGILVAMVLATASSLMISCKNEEAKPAFDLAVAKKTVEDRSKIFAEAMNNNDSIELANCYTTDAKFMQPNGKSVVGRANIQKLIGQMMKTGMPHFTIETIEVWGDENILTAEENWTFTDKDKKVLDAGKSLEVFKMEDGVWKLHRDCYNSDMPLPMK